MVFTYARIRVANPLALTVFKEVELLVDSGAVFTSLPRSILEELGLKPIDKEKLKVYGGAVVEREVGWASIEFGGKRRVIPVIFGESGDTPVLGVASLEALGYQIDSMTKKLKPTEFLMI
jgi:clan AA aspartic protease